MKSSASADCRAASSPLRCATSGATDARERAGSAAAAAAQLLCRPRMGTVKHVIYLQFDNTHYNRDNPNVASDLEQMPHLLNFLRRTARCSRTTTRS